MAKTPIKIPESDVLTTDWTLSSGEDAAALLATDEDTDYVYAEASAKTILVDVGDIPLNSTNITVTVNVRTGASTGGQGAKIACKLGSDTSYGAVFEPVTEAANLLNAEEIACPDGGIWTPAKFNAASFGLTTTTVDALETVTLYQLWVYPEFSSISGPGRMFRMFLTSPTKPAKDKKPKKGAK